MGDQFVEDDMVASQETTHLQDLMAGDNSCFLAFGPFFCKTFPREDLPTVYITVMVPFAHGGEVVKIPYGNPRLLAEFADCRVERKFVFLYPSPREFPQGVGMVLLPND